LGDISLPALDKLLRSGRSLSIHAGKGRVISIVLDSASALIGQRVGEVVRGADGVTLVAVVRGEQVVGLADPQPLQTGDRLILSGPARACDTFRTRATGPATPSAS
jgi:K+/H+ antiporter YhaU regulatory subunit KhtT